jgi:primosomal protein N''
MSSDEPANSIPELISQAIKEELFKTANTLFKYGLEKAEKEWKKINALTEGVILWCKNYEELESMEFFRDNLLPMVKAIQLGMVQDEITEWEKDIAEYINRVEDECEQYAFSRKMLGEKLFQMERNMA